MKILAEFISAAFLGYLTVAGAILVWVRLNSILGRKIK
jgi:hypothetical protein